MKLTNPRTRRFGAALAGLALAAGSVAVFQSSAGAVDITPEVRQTVGSVVGVDVTPWPAPTNTTTVTVTVNDVLTGGGVPLNGVASGAAVICGNHDSLGNPLTLAQQADPNNCDGAAQIANIVFVNFVNGDATFNFTLRAGGIGNNNAQCLPGGEQPCIIGLGDVAAGGTAVALGIPVFGGCFARTPTIVGTAGNDSITGTAGADVIVGLGGDDVIIGAGGNDFLCGNDGDDELVGRAGNDGLDGGAGDDKLNGGADVDTVDYSNSPAGIVVVIDGAANDGTFFEADNVATDIERVIGSMFGDVIHTNNISNVAIGGPGDDRIFGAGGVDVIDGGPGNDSLLGGTGSDTIDGGPDNDYCNGQGDPDAGANCEIVLSIP